MLVLADRTALSPFFPLPAHSSQPWNRATPNPPHTGLKASLLLFPQLLFGQTPSAHGQVRISLNELTPTSLQWLRMANVQSRGHKTTSLGTREPWLQRSRQLWPQAGAHLQACAAPSFVKPHLRNVLPSGYEKASPMPKDKPTKAHFSDH